MEARCSFAGCHGGNVPSAQLDLTTYEGYLAGGVSGNITGWRPAESIPQIISAADETDG